MDFKGAEEYIVSRLRNELPATLFYHTLGHTLNVQKVVKQLILKEKIDPQTGLIIETAALFHDSGMIFNYKEHEIESVGIVRDTLPLYVYSSNEIDEICDLIMITRLPQRPLTYTGQVLCDADMDNLGRDDFFIQSFRLKLELEMNGVGTSTIKKWLANLVQFLEEHTFYTASAIELRQAKKMQNLSELREIVILY